MSDSAEPRPTDSLTLDDGALSRRNFVAAVTAAVSLPWSSALSAAVATPADLTQENLHYASATTLAAAIKAKKVSSVEALEACIKRTGEVNGKINAMVQPAYEAARAAAKKADAALARGATLGPLHGVPFSIKDSIETAGIISTAGTKGWAKRVPTRDATVVARLKAAGGILMGKTNTPEFTLSDETDNAVYGRTNNPYDLSRTTGGSSGGPVALIATGGTPFDIGSDTGNSIRMPAHNCGVAGLKPTQGRVPKTGHAVDYRGFIESWTQLGPLARYVEDLALILPIISGIDAEDPHAMPVPLRDHKRVVVSTLRVAFFTDNGMMKPTKETVQTVEAAAEAFRKAGAKVEQHDIPKLNDATKSWHEVWTADGGEWARRLLQNAGTAGDGTIPGMFKSKAVSPGELTAMLERLDGVRAELTVIMQPYDLIVCPVMAMPAVKHGGSNAEGYGDTYNEPHNITGWPAAVVRGGTSPEGLPIGVQIVAKPWREDVALAGAFVVEKALGGWKAPQI
jgi:amidase